MPAEPGVAVPSLFALASRLVKRLAFSPAGRPVPALLLAALALLPACRRDEPDPEVPPVRTVLTGTITAPDSVRGPFELFVLNRDSVRTDTLGHVRVGADGRFTFSVVAPERGVYPLALVVAGRVVRIEPLVVAAGDSARVDVRFPLGRRPLRIRSAENDAWTAYRNAKAQQGLALRSAAAGGAPAEPGLLARQTASILWSLREAFPGTVASEIGAAESLALLEGLDDSLVVARAALVTPEQAGYTTAGEVARRSEARLRGQAAAVALLERFRDRAVRPEQKAKLQAALVATHLDSLDETAAVAAADRLLADHPASPWADWARGAKLEAQTLLPGKPAPDVTARAFDGATLSVGGFRGRTVLLEFFRPDDRYLALLPAREALRASLAGRPFEIVSVGVEADTLVTRGFFSQSRLPGRLVVTSGPTSDFAQRYNVRVTPSWFLVDARGVIRGKYVGPLAFATAAADARALAGAPSARSSVPQAPPTR